VHALKSHVRTSVRGTVAAIAVTVASLAVVAPAGAVIVQVKDGAETIEVGVQRRKAPKVEKQRLQWHGGPVDPASYTYAIYWDPVQAYHNDWMRLIDGYLHDVGAASGQSSDVFALTGQYRSADGTRADYKSTFRGAYTDTFPYPAANDCHEPHARAVCLTDKQIRAELTRFIAAGHLPTGREVIYFVLTPPAVTVCLDETGTGDCSTSDKEIEEEATPEGALNKPGPAASATGFCGYHSIVEPAAESPIVYGVQPWIAGHAGHVIQENPLVNELPTGAALACQNGKVLVEPNQASSFSHFNYYETGLADLIDNGLSMEQTDIVIDPRVSDGWYQSTSNLEQTDMCRGVFNPPKEEQKEEKPPPTQALREANESINDHGYYLQYSYSSVAATSGQEDLCWSGVELDPHFTATNLVKGGDIVAFDALESGVTLDANPANLASDEPFTAPTYEWEFGDGASAGPNTEASVFHTYQYRGEYTVKLTVTDSGGNVATYKQVVPVSGPPAPTPPPTPGVTPGASLPSQSAPSGASSGTGTASAPAGAPTLTQSVLSRSLSKAIRLGLALHYNVDEQVAGRAEALLNAATAAHLHIRGHAATGLPQGYPREIVIGSAVLVTTRAGQGTLRIRFSKTIARRLAKVHRVKLTLRFVLRNVSNGGVHTTTALSTVVLSH
jgi:PKD domain